MMDDLDVALYDIDEVLGLARLWKAGEKLLQDANAEYPEGVALYCDRSKNNTVIALYNMPETPAQIKVELYPHAAERLYDTVIEALLAGATIAHGVNLPADESHKTILKAEVDVMNHAEYLDVAYLDLAKRKAKVLNHDALVSAAQMVCKANRIWDLTLVRFADLAWKAKLAEHPVKAQADFVSSLGSKVTVEGYVTGHSYEGRSVLFMSREEIETKLAGFLHARHGFLITFDEDAKTCLFGIDCDDGQFVGWPTVTKATEIDGELYYPVASSLSGWQDVVEIEQERDVADEEER